MASGKAVIALGRGGVMESVPPDSTPGGFLYQQPGAASLEAAIRRFEQVEASVQPEELQSWAARFSVARFREEMMRVIDRTGTHAGEAEFAVEEAVRVGANG
jgi:hypothetical protein